MIRAAFLTISFLWLVVINSTAHANYDSLPQTYNVAIEADDITTHILFDSAADHLDLNLKYITYPSFDAILKAIEAGKADFAANVTFTEERSIRFEISHPTNIEYTYLFSKKGTHLNEIKVVGVPEGTIYGDLIREYYPEIKQISYLGHDAAVDLLKTNAVGGVVDAINQLKPMLMKGFEAEILNDQIPIKPVSIVAPTGKHTELLRKIQEHTNSETVQRELSEAIKKYQFTIRQQSLRAAVRQSKLDLQKTYTVKSENLDEYTVYHENGTIEGISVDVVYQACGILGIKCEIISTADETWESMYSDLLRKDIDIISAAIIAQSRKNYMYFSEPYYSPEVLLIKRQGYKNNVYSNISELITERIGVIKEDFYDSLLSRMLPNKALYKYSNQESQVQALLNNEVDYIVLSRTNYNHLLLKSEMVLPFEEDTLIGSFYSSKVAVAFAKNEMGQQLSPLFSRAIQMLNLPQIINKYNVVPDWRANLLSEKEFNSYRLWLLFFLLALVVAIAYYLHVQSITDNLTKLKNRRALYRKYSRGISAQHTVIYLDVNKFKSINDTYGHEVGDKVLELLAEKINTNWKGNAYRIGGDEFILICNEKLSEKRECLFNSISNFESFSYIDSQNDLSLIVSSAVGISWRRKHHMPLENVLRDTEAEMYKAKYSALDSRTSLDIQSN